MDDDIIIINDFDLSNVLRRELKRIGIEPKYTGVTEFRKFSKECDSVWI